MEMILVQVETITGQGVNWALHKALYGFDHDVNSVANQRILAHSPDTGYFEPLSNWNQLGPLLKKYQVQFFIEDLRNLWTIPGEEKAIQYRATASGCIGAGKQHAMATGPDHELAACRAILHLLLGREFRIPACYIQGQLVAC